ncbi:sulfate transporter family-domain-containing protein [Pyronema domesticum]|uniref:Similar to Probable sulfate permease C3H7.02 acc. no. O74377 n=1 Tax=Pyronema omphalodes (strain CBS 100304) TaxID=1076935 RepID=U4LLE0_PYROM|nr:sulfate transporter family-domain-containing protein [Pyronema domesticum]CCX32382.1 Similar to Probable sulfate permease C3H7.02; acc. no. O74377 [Pyronema omphalodes CBS 100304]
MSSSKDAIVDSIDASKSNPNSIARDDSYSAGENDIFIDRTISVKDWAARTFSDIPGQLWGYVLSLFPIVTWIYRYNFTWFVGDVIAGLTVGAVVVPQSMSYAILASLNPEYGLYSSFIGVFIYCFFATSKDVTIGPVAVMSLEVGKVIHHVKEVTGDTYSNAEIATALAFISGIICLGIGLLRCGFILEFIPAPAVAGFMTGSAFTIATTQIPSLLGISSKYVNSRDSAYKVVIDTLKNLKHAKLDAAFGLSALVGLYFIRFGFEWLGNRYPQHRRKFFFSNVMRNGIVVIVVTIASYLVNRGAVGAGHAPRVKILQQVPRGFRNVGPLRIDSTLINAIGPQIPVATLILLLEHIAIAKSFGRINDYKIIPDQELIAIGVTNVVGNFFNAYPATGSFSRTALKSKSGVRTPAAGIITGIVVLLALYALTDAFYWIPMSGLAAVIIHAVTDLLSPPRQVYIFWRVQPLEAVIFVAAVFITIFTNIENGIYWAIISSALLLLYRIARPRGDFLGRLRLHNGNQQRDIWVPVSKRLLNPNVAIRTPPPGILVFRPTESFTYPNASTQVDILVDEIKRVTKRGKSNAFATLGDRPWNDMGPRRGFTQEEIDSDKRPVLRAVILDFSAVASIDTTGVQCLVDTRRQLCKYADREVEFHFANIISPWVRRSLLAGGFGTGQPKAGLPELAAVVPALGEDNREVLKKYRRSGKSEEKRERLDRLKGYLFSTEYKDGRFAGREEYKDLEVDGQVDGREKEQWGPALSQDTPFFHIDIPDLSHLGDDEVEQE